MPVFSSWWIGLLLGIYRPRRRPPMREWSRRSFQDSWSSSIGISLMQRARNRQPLRMWTGFVQKKQDTQFIKILSHGFPWLSFDHVPLFKIMATKIGVFSCTMPCTKLDDLYPGVPEALVNEDAGRSKLSGTSRRDVTFGMMFLDMWRFPRGYHQIIHFSRIFHYEPSSLGYHPFRKHPCSLIYSIGNHCLRWHSFRLVIL